MRPVETRGVKSPAWRTKLAAVYRWLRPDAEMRRRTRYYIFDLIGWVAGAKIDAQPQNNRRNQR